MPAKFKRKASADNEDNSYEDIKPIVLELKDDGQLIQLPEEQANSGDEDEEVPCVYRTDRFCISSEKEHILASWFEVHPEFYQKSHRRYSDRPYKDKQIAIIASKIDEPVEKILGWFRNQRTAVGKIFKISGPALEKLTQRKAWQRSTFWFLKEHIEARSYSAKMATISSTLEDEEPESSTSFPEAPNSPCTVNNFEPPNKMARLLEGARQQFLLRSTPTESSTEDFKVNSYTEDERDASGQWPNSGSDDEESSSCAFRADRFCMSSQKEHILASWFESHPEFYQRSHRRYSDKTYKDKQINIIAAQIEEPVEKILGWFRNQRTAVGKIFKISGPALEKLTQRKAWQRKTFWFLKEHIESRSYSAKPTKRTAEEERSEESEFSTSAQQEISTPCIVTKVLRSNNKSGLDDEASVQYLNRPLQTENVKEEKNHIPCHQQERAAFGQWLLARINKVSDDRWEEFQRAAFEFVMDWTLQPSSNVQQQGPS